MTTASRHPNVLNPRGAAADISGARTNGRFGPSSATWKWSSKGPHGHEASQGWGEGGAGPMARATRSVRGAACGRLPRSYRLVRGGRHVHGPRVATTSVRPLFGRVVDRHSGGPHCRPQGDGADHPARTAAGDVVEDDHGLPRSGPQPVGGGSPIGRSPRPGAASGGGSHAGVGGRAHGGGREDPGSGRRAQRPRPNDRGVMESGCGS